MIKKKKKKKFINIHFHFRSRRKTADVMRLPLQFCLMYFLFCTVLSLLQEKAISLNINNTVKNIKETEQP